MDRLVISFFPIIIIIILPPRTPYPPEINDRRAVALRVTLAATCTMSFPVRPGSAQPASRDSLGKDKNSPAPASQPAYESTPTMFRE